jgi:hypothetical protein
MIHHFWFLPAMLRFSWARRAAWHRYKRDELRGHPLARRLFKHRHRYDVNLQRPQTHSERIHARKLFDHNPVFTQITDKYLARGFIEGVLGPGSVDKLMVPLLARAATLYELPADIWQQNVIVKCSHGSGMNCAVQAGDTRARKQALRKIKYWLGKPHGARKSEWCYLGLEPGLIVEPLLPGVQDLKLYFYDGELRFIMAENNSGRIPGISMYTPDWQRLPYRWPKFKTADCRRPNRLEEIIEVARSLAASFDMIRVDFLLTDDRFYLGELTVYDGSGLAAFSSYEDDLAFAQYWQQPHLGFDKSY